MKDSDEIVARIQKSGVVLEGKKGTPSKKITHSDFIEGYGIIFKDNIERARMEEEVSKDPFLLPPNVYLFNETKSGLEVGLYYREKTVPSVRFGSKSIKDVKLPNIVLSVRLRKAENNRDPDIKYVYQDLRLFATDQGPLSLPGTLLSAPNNRQHIWVLPLPNVFPDARLCFGGNSYIQNYSRDLRALHYFYRTIYETPFNNDLSVPALSQREGPSAWLKTLGNAKSFPYGKLSGFKPELHKKHQHELEAVSA